MLLNCWCKVSRINTLDKQLSKSDMLWKTLINVLFTWMHVPTFVVFHFWMFLLMKTGIKLRLGKLNSIYRSCKTLYNSRCGFYVWGLEIKSKILLRNYFFLKKKKKKTRYFRGSRFSQCLILSSALHCSLLSNLLY